MKKMQILTMSFIMLFVWQSSAQTTIIDPIGAGGFELGTTFASNGWTTVNATTNTWNVGTSPGWFAGTGGAFISNNASLAWAYTNSTISRSHFYRNITVPSGETNINLSFNWRANGNDGNWDNLLVYICDTSITPTTAGPTSTNTTTTTWGGYTNGTTGYFLLQRNGTSVPTTTTTVTYTLTAAQAAYLAVGTPKRIVFTWKNDGGGGTNPPASIDNISLTSSCTPPSATAATAITKNSATLNSAPFTGATGYNFRYRTVGSTTWILATGNPYTTNTASISGLTSNTNYEFQVSAAGPVCNVWSPSLTFETVPDYCSGDHFYDNGGTADYLSGGTTTICPDNPGDVVYVNFLSFEVEGAGTNSCYDRLRIYDGDDNTTTQITPASLGLGTGTDGFCYESATDGTANLVGETIISSHASGCLTFVFTIDGSGFRDGWEASVTCAPPPTCFQPSDLVSSNTGLDSANISWTTGGATSWVIEYDTAGFTLGTGNVVTVNTDTFTTLTGLNSLTDYEWYVRDYCGAGDSSIWSTSASFETAPDYCAGDHFYDNGGTADYLSTGDTTTICPNNPGDVVYVNFLSFEVEGAGTNSCYDRLRIYDGNDNTTTQITPASLGLGTGTDGFCYESATDGTANLVGETIISSHASGCLTFVFTTDVSGVRDGWEASVTCAPPPTCFQPSDLVSSNTGLDSANISWTTGGATSWVIEYDTAGFTLGTGNVVTVNTDTFTTLTGLNSLTDYEWYVRDYCGAGDSSIWSTSASFETAPDYCAGDHFYDNGGTADYLSTGDTTTICPNNPGDVVYVNFLSFEVEGAGTNSCYDRLRIYDGNDNTTTQITPASLGLGTGTDGFCYESATDGTANLVGETIISSHASGCLTFVFTTDVSGVRDGWEASVTCAPRPAADISVLEVLNSSDSCGMAQTVVELEISNLGSATQYNVPIVVEVTGDFSYTFNATVDSIRNTDTINFVVDSFSTLSGGTANITAYSNLMGDPNLNNDTTILTVEFLEQISSPTTTDVDVCSNEDSVVLSATLANGDTLTWFGSDTVTEIGSTVNTNITVPNPGASTTYFVSAKGANPANSCPSDLTPVNVSVLTSSNQMINVTTCDEFTYNGTTVTTTGFYTDSLSSVNGCDSVITYNVTINNSTMQTQTPSICDGDTIVVGGNEYFTTGLYTDTLTNALGCDSILTTDLTVNTPSAVTITGLTPEICDNAGIITVSTDPLGGTLSGSGVNGNNFDPASAGQGFHTITYSLTDGNGCTSSISVDIEVIECTGIQEITGIEKMIVYPNPFVNSINLQFNDKKSGELRIKLYDVNGRMILSKDVVSVYGVNNIELLIPENTANGVHLIQLERDGASYSRSLLKK